jgi:DNA-binding NtrC family response regulator
MTQTIENRVLICDDEKNMRRVLQDILADDGWTTEAVASGEDLLKLIDEGQQYDAIIVDLSLPGMNGLEVIENLKERGVESGMVVITAYGSVDAAVQAMQCGAVDFLIKPFDNLRIKGTLRKIRESRGLIDDIKISMPSLVGANNLPLPMVGQDPRLTSIFQLVKQIASTKTSVLIHGESGTGKELVAQAVHFNGNRCHMPFVPVNCAALPETLLESEFFGHERGAFTGAHAKSHGKFELANQGTLFLDEIGDMPLSLQVKLLRVLQEQRLTRVGGEKEISIDVRIIAATNQNLEEMVKLKMFREDLFYRLNVIPVHLPSLRERKDDIPHLIEHFTIKFAQRHHMPRLVMSDKHLASLTNYPWPGNIRELQNAVEKATVLQDPAALVAITQSHTPHTPSSTLNQMSSYSQSTFEPDENQSLINLGEEDQIRNLNEVSADAQRAAVIRALKICKGNKSEAAKQLGISYKTLFNKIDDLEIQISTNVE